MAQRDKLEIQHIIGSDPSNRHGVPSFGASVQSRLGSVGLLHDYDRLFGRTWTRQGLRLARVRSEHGLDLVD